MDCRSTKGTLIIQDENEKEEEDFIDPVNMYDDNVPITYNIIGKEDNSKY